MLISVMSVLAVGITLTGAACSSSAPPPPSATKSPTQKSSDAPSDLTHWTKVWSGTFGGKAGSPPSQRYWQYDLNDQDFGTGEVETTTTLAANIEQDGRGDLKITPRLGPSGWTSARIQTRGYQFAAPPGGEMLVTASIKQPDPAVGAGYWTGFWMLGPGQWPEHGEIDILENVNAGNRTSGTLHCGNLTHRNPDGTTGPCHQPDGMSSGLVPCPGCQTGFHTYSLIVDRRNKADQQIRWYLDNREFFSVSESQVGTAAWTEAIDHPFTIILDVAIGGSYPDLQCQCHTPFPDTSPGASMLIRNVSVYTTKG